MHCVDQTLAEISEEVSRIITYWKGSSGLAPIKTKELLDNSMLEWQISLADTLPLWRDAKTPGEIILAWTNIGALVEGLMKLFLCIYYAEYLKQAEKKGPDELTLETLRQFFNKNVWYHEEWDKWLQVVQIRRNAVHAFRRKDIGTTKDLQDTFPILLKFIRTIDERLPYPSS